MNVISNIQISYMICFLYHLNEVFTVRAINPDSVIFDFNMYIADRAAAFAVQRPVLRLSKSKVQL